LHQPTETRTHAKAALQLAPALGRPRRRTGHPLGHDHLDMPVTRPSGHGPGHRRGWLNQLRATLGLPSRRHAV
jgi:hypothetical protein